MTVIRLEMSRVKRTWRMRAFDLWWNVIGWPLHKRRVRLNRGVRRRIFHRYWWTLGWSNERAPSRPHLTWSLCLSNFNRLIVRWEWRDPDCRWFVIEWGNGNSDPAWSIGYQW